MPKTQTVLLLAAGLLMVAGCAVKRPLFSPHRSNTTDHRQAATIADCLDCHSPDTIPHDPERGNCLKCHRLERGK